MMLLLSDAPASDMPRSSVWPFRSRVIFFAFTSRGLSVALPLISCMTVTVSPSEADKSAVRRDSQVMPHWAVTVMSSSTLTEEPA